jgi:DNA repair photolyase
MQILGAVKKRALSEGHIGCVGDVSTLNIARGCAGACVFCHSRCIPGAPDPEQMLLYFDLPQQLRHELDQRRRSPPPPFVLCCTATDGFLGGPAVQQITRACLEILLNRGIGISLSTRGVIADDTLTLLGRHAPYVRITVPIPSVSEEHWRTWEPGTASPQQRLFLVQRLLQAGIQPRIRIEPLIPFVNDHTEQVRDVVSAIVGLGLDEATTGFLHLRPGVAEQLRREAPDEPQRLILGSFPTEGDFRHLPLRTRVASLRRVQRIGREHGLRVSACHCQNPGIAAGRCPIAPPQLPQPKNEQRLLFDDEG